METQYCINHEKPDNKYEYEFYCFDCQNFLCNQCFKKHHKHNFEIKEEIKKYENFFQKVKNNGQSPQQFSEGIEYGIKKIFKELTDKLNEFNINLKEEEGISNNFNKKTEYNNIFDFDYNEYENFQKLIDICNFLHSISRKINKLVNGFKYYKYQNLRIIDKEISLVSKKGENDEYPISIMLNKEEGKYTKFTEQESNIIIDLNQKHYIKNIKIMNDDYTFEYKLGVSIRDNNGYWNQIKEFHVSKNTNKFSLHNFEVEEEAVLVKLSFIQIPSYNVRLSRKKNYIYDINPNNQILIKQLMLEIGDIIEE